MKIAILGAGTVGSGVIKVIQQYNTHAEQPIEIKYLFAKEVRDKTLDLSQIKVTNNLQDILESDVELVVEVLGGVEFSLEVHRSCIKAGKHIVTANKDLLALHIEELAQLANDHNVQIGYEASCAGGIPIVQTLQFLLRSNTITRVLGILNGTTNYILTQMLQQQCSYETVLQQAMDLGYAEKDPTNDVGGFDARRKIALLSRLAYQQSIEVEDVSVKGIESVELIDLMIAQSIGYTLKLIGKSQKDDTGISIGVEPMLLSHHHTLSHVQNEKNAVYIQGSAVGETMYYGPGAGSLETASAVVSDILFINQFGFVGNLVTQNKAVIKEKEAVISDYYIRYTSQSNTQNDQFEQLGIKVTPITTEMTQDEVLIIHNVTAEQLSILQTIIPLHAVYPIEGGYQNV